MKKLIAVLLTCAFVLSMAACSAKEVIDTAGNIVENGGSSQQGGTMTPSDEKVEGGAISSGNGGQDPTEPSDDPNKIGSVVVITPDGGGISAGDGTNSDQGDTVIKVEINNGENNEPVVVTPPDSGENNSFVIDFDQLMGAS